MKELSNKGGQQCGLVAFDSRAGEPKRPNTTGGGYASGGPNVGVAFRKGSEPKNPAKFVKNLKGKRDRRFFEAEPSAFSPTGSPLRASSPGRTEYDAPVKYGDVFVYHSTHTPPVSLATIPTGTSNPLPPAPKFGALDLSSKSVTIHPKIVHQMSGTRADEGAQLKTVMGGMTAFQAAGFGNLAPTGDWAWLHLLAYSLGGMDGKNPDVPENLVAGTQRANIYHLAIESAVKRLAIDHNFGAQITVSFRGHQDVTWHLVEYLVYQVASPSDNSKSVTFTVECFKTETGYGGDTKVIYEVLRKLFELKKLD